MNYLLASIFLFFTATVSTTAEETYDLHAALALTGLASPFGTHEKNGAALAVEDFNQSDSIDNKKVRLIVEDTMGDNPHTLIAINKLISLNKAKIIIGPTWLDSYQSALTPTNNKNVFLFTPSAFVKIFKKKPTDYPYVFSNLYNVDVETRVILKTIKDRGISRVVLAFDNDPFFQYTRLSALKIADELGIEVIHSDTLDIGMNDFKSYLGKITKMKAEGVFVGLGDEKSLFTFFKQRSEVNPELPVFSYDYIEPYFHSPEWKPYEKNLTWASPITKNKTFESAYKTRFKTNPNYGAYLSYDTATIILKAAKLGIRQSETLRDYLLKNSFDSVMYGSLKFNEYGMVDVGEFEVKSR